MILLLFNFFSLSDGLCNVPQKVKKTWPVGLEIFGLGELECRGHFQAVLISFIRRALSEDNGKYPNLKAKIHMYKDFFLYHMIVHSFMNYNRKLELDLVVTSMTTQIIKGLKLQKITLDIYMIKTFNCRYHSKR